MTIRFLITVLAVALMMADARAQGVGGMGGAGGGGGGRHQQRDKTDDKPEPAKPKVDEKAYNSALKSIPDKHYDAWGAVR